MSRDVSSRWFQIQSSQHCELIKKSGHELTLAMAAQQDLHKNKQDQSTAQWATLIDLKKGGEHEGWVYSVGS